MCTSFFMAQLFNKVKGMIIKNSIAWKKGIFSDTYRVYSNNQQIGELKNRAFSRHI